MGGKEQARSGPLCLSQHKLSYNYPFSANQFRALEEDEIMFLDSIREKQEEEERVRKEMDGEELKNFREYACIAPLILFVF